MGHEWVFIPLMTTTTQPAPSATDSLSTENWRTIVRKYQTPCLKQSLWQITNTFVPYVALWVLMAYSVSVSWPLTLALAACAALFLVRIFIIFHDCGHGSFFRSKRANYYLGFLSGLITLTPYRQWTWQHAVHHGTSGNLDARGTGDIWTMTVNEYKSASTMVRLQYRFCRNPIVVFLLAPLGIFLVYQRFPSKKASKRDRRDVHWMNGAILLYCIAMSLIFGFWHFLWIQLTVTGISGFLGVWLFYVQHQFEDTYWKSGKQWDYATSALRGSSFYKLPAVLNWFSGNIGYHHIHHLSSRIPNYKLKACHEAEPLFQQVPELTLRSSLKSLKLRLWDEDSQKLVGYRHLKHSSL